MGIRVHVFKPGTDSANCPTASWQSLSWQSSKTPRPLRQCLRAALRSDDADIVSLRAAHTSSTEWAHTWKTTHSTALGDRHAETVWRPLQGKLFG